MTSWTASNLATQGFCLTEGESRALRVGLRFSTGLCLALVVTGLGLRSAVLILALVPVGAIAGWSPRHPFDLIWNRALRHLTRAPELPTNPQRRRHAFKLATVWLLVVGLLLATGASGPALGLGLVLVGVCSVVTTTNFCVPSTLLALRERRNQTATPTAVNWRPLMYATHKENKE